MASRKKSKGGFALTGKAKPPQFGRTAGGASTKGFKQHTPKTATAAMQGSAMPSGKGEADKGPRKDAKKQFGSAPGKKVF
jgi:hypothetical protein